MLGNGKMIDGFQRAQRGWGEISKLNKVSGRGMARVILRRFNLYFI